MKRVAFDCAEGFLEASLGSNRQGLPVYPVSEVIGQLLGTFVAIRGCFLKTLEADQIESIIDLFVSFCEGGWITVKDVLKGLNVRFGSKRGAAGQLLVEDGPKREDVRGGADWAEIVADLFRGHIVRSADHRSGVGEVQVIIDSFGEPEICDVRFA